MDSRFNNLDFSIIVSLKSYQRLLKILNKIFADSTPISNAGCVIVVSGGLSSSACARLEKLTSFKSAGMDSFNSLQA